MTAEAEVCNGAVSEVAGIEEKREFKARSFQDLAKPELEGIGNHDQADDPEDSYVLVTDDGDPSADGKDMAAMDGCARHESSVPGELSGTKLDFRNENPEGTNVVKHKNAEAGDAAMDGSPQHASNAPFELLGTELDARNGNPEGETNVGKHGNMEAGDHESSASCELLGTELDSWNPDGVNVGKHTLVNGSPDVQVISIVDGDGNQDNTLEEENKCSEELNDQNRKISIIVDGGGNQDNTVEEENKCSEELNDQNGKISVIVDGGGNQDNTVEEENKCSEEWNDQNGKIDVVNGEDDPTLMEGGIGDAGSSDESISVVDGVLMGVEGSVPDEDEIQDMLAVRKPECEAESEIEKAEHSNGKIERSEEAEIAKFEDQNWNIGVVAVAKPDSVKENQESEVPNVALVADSGEDDGPNLLSPSDKHETIEDEAELALGKEAMQDQKCDIYPENDVQYGATPQLSVSEKEAEASGLTQKQSVVHKPENEVQISDVDTGNSCSIDISKASPDSSSDTVTKEDVSGVVVTKPFNFFVRTPRYSDEKLQEQIRIAELEVNDKTKLRDSIQAQIQEIRAKNQNNGIDHEYAKGEDRSVKKLLKEKRMEIDSLQSVVNKAKNAISIEDLNSRIKTIEYMIQHETLPLKEEKQLIHEIKQLKQLREQLSSSKCSQNEIQQALEHREQAEERLKTLRKELGNLKDTASKAQTACDEAESKYNVEYKKVKELQARFRAADVVRQEAYAKFLSLSKEFSQKRKNFFKFKNDSASATYYAFTDDRKTLYRHCVNEVENFMELWNGNEEFRSEYVRLNTRSTLRRFGKLDGRSLGPDEKPTVLPSYVRERNDKVVSVPVNVDSISKVPAIELKRETKNENVSSGIHSSNNETESKVKTVSSRGPARLVTVPGMDDENVKVQEEPVKTEEELELIRKAEDLRREEADAKLNEQRRLEEIVKAKEARERKQRRDEKAQKREELKARKEAEQKEKEREKKSKKRERRKAASTSTSTPMDMQDDASSITSVEISKEEASTHVSDVSTKKRKTSRVLVSKQNKTRSAPPPSLRNRNRRKWQQWMWPILISLAVLVLFWLGNLGVFSSVNSKLQGSAGF